MTRTTLRVRALAAAAVGLAVAAGCAHPAPTATSHASPNLVATGPSSSPAASTPTPTGPVSTVTSVSTPDPRVSLAPAAVVSTRPYSHGRAGVPAGGLAAVSTRTSPDPLVVTAAALRVLFGSDTTLDTEPMDAEKRALPWLGGPFAAAVASAQIVAAPGAVWNRWAVHHAHLVVTVARCYDDGAPPDTATAVHRQWLVTQTPVGTTPADARWVGTPVLTVVYTTTTRSDGRWAVTTLKEAP